MLKFGLYLGAAFLSAALASCVDDDDTIAPPVSPTVHVSLLSLDDLGEDPPMIAVAKKLPTFGGFWFNDQDQLVVGLTDVRDLPKAQALIEPQLGAHQPTGGFVAQQVEYSFEQLARWRKVLRQRGIFQISGANVLGVRESENRVHVGIENAQTEPAVRAMLGAAGVPQHAVMFRILRRPVKSMRRSSLFMHFGALTRITNSNTLTTTLRTSHDTLIGGLEIRVGSQGQCTLAFPVIRSNGSSGWLTNSHCTMTDAGFDGSAAEQPINSSPRVVGYEVLDPQPHTCGYPGFEDDCRNADVALFSALIPIELGRIARTNYRRACETGSCGESVTIDASNPRIVVDGRNDNVFENETLDKIGRTTGWTYGNVEDTCDDWQADTFVKECSDRVDYGAAGGDSGSPVFFLKSNGAAELRGIHHGSQGGPLGYADSWMSDLHQIELDLGPLVVYYKSMNPYIVGATVVPANVQCDWIGEQNGGQPTYQYIFKRNGVTVSSSNHYFASTGSTDFYLDFLVTDGRSNTASATIFVDVDPNLTEKACAGE